MLYAKPSIALSITVNSTSSLIAAISSPLRYSDIYLASTELPYLISSPMIISRPVSLFAAPITALKQTMPVLDMQHKTRAFEIIAGGSLTLQGLWLRNGKGETPSSSLALGGTPSGGGCIAMYTATASSTGSAFQTEQHLSIDQCVFTNCRTDTGSGGALLLYTPFMSSLRIRDSRFENNTSRWSGGAIWFEILPGELNVADALEISSSKFWYNRAGDYAGALYVASPCAQNARLRDVDFFSNVAVGEGGALALEHPFAISTSSFRNNKALEVGRANAIMLLNNDVIVYLDQSSADQALAEGLFAPAPHRQIQVIDFTEAPASHEPTLAPTVFISRVPTSLPSTSAPTQAEPTTDTGLIAGLSSVFAVLMLALVAYQKRRQQNNGNRLSLSNGGRPSSVDQDMERLHNEQMLRRRRAPVLHIKDSMLLPVDCAGNAGCSICFTNPDELDGCATPCTWDVFDKVRLAESRANMDDITLQNTFCRLSDCGHVFHTACLIQYVEYKSGITCPNCRTSLQMDLRRQRSSTSGAVLLFDTASHRSLTIIVPSNHNMQESQAQIRRSAQADDVRQESGSLVVSPTTEEAECNNGAVSV